MQAVRSAEDERGVHSETPAETTRSERKAGEQADDHAAHHANPGFAARGRLRRRARFLRAARELAYRDLGGLVFDLDRFGQRNDALVRAKLDTLLRIDSELRAVEGALGRRRSLSILREAGVAACPRCAAIHSSADRYCPACGLTVAEADRPIGIGSAHAMSPPPARSEQPLSPREGTGAARTAAAPAEQPPEAETGSGGGDAGSIAGGRAGADHASSLPAGQRDSFTHPHGSDNPTEVLR